MEWKATIMCTFEYVNTEGTIVEKIDGFKHLDLNCVDLEDKMYIDVNNEREVLAFHIERMIENISAMFLGSDDINIILGLVKVITKSIRDSYDVDILDKDEVTEVMDKIRYCVNLYELDFNIDLDIEEVNAKAEPKLYDTPNPTEEELNEAKEAASDKADS